MIEYNIRINLQGERELYTNVIFTTGDSRGYRLNFAFYSYGVRLDVSGHALTVKAKRSDGQVIIDSGVTEAEGACYVVADNAYNAEGALEFEIALVGPDESLVTSSVLHCYVREGFGEGDLAPEDVTPILAKAAAAENQRQAAEESRGEAEELRELAEGLREEAEGLRKESEAVRDTAEGARGEAERARILAEEQRAAAEAGRAAAEKTRVSYENARQASESGRVAAEEERVSAEAARSAAENERQAAEEKRQESFRQSYNNVANALRGSVSGSVIRVDDVSPVLHEPEVVVRSKNLIRYPYNYAGTYNTNGIAFTINTDGSVTANGTAGASTAYLALNGGYSGAALIPDYLEVGKTYTITDARLFLYSESGSTRSFAGTFVMPDGYKYYGIFITVYEETLENKIYYPQIEEGSTATEYTSYVSPESVTVMQYGKNLFCCNDVNAVTAGVTVTAAYGGSSFKITGTAAQSQQVGVIGNAVLPAGTFTASLFGANKLSASYDRIYLRDSNSTIVMNNILSDSPGSFTLTEPTTINVLFVVGEGSSYSDSEIGIQIEAGAVSTEYEPYQEPAVYAANADGTVEGVASLSPTMTLLTDTEGTVIDCTYNRDINKVIEQLTNAMISMGGNV